MEVAGCTGEGDKISQLHGRWHPNCLHALGALKRKRYWADITGGGATPEALFEQFLEHFNDVTPVFVEVGDEPSSADEIEEGETLMLSLAMRGHVQVRVTGLEERRVTLITLAGHPPAGAVRFSLRAAWRCRALSGGSP